MRSDCSSPLLAVSCCSLAVLGKVIFGYVVYLCQEPAVSQKSIITWSCIAVASGNILSPRGTLFFSLRRLRRLTANKWTSTRKICINWNYRCTYKADYITLVIQRHVMHRRGICSNMYYLNYITGVATLRACWWTVDLLRPWKKRWMTFNKCNWTLDF